MVPFKTQESVNGKPFRFVVRAIVESDFGVIAADGNGGCESYYVVDVVVGGAVVGLVAS